MRLARNRDDLGVDGYEVREVVVDGCSISLGLLGEVERLAWIRLELPFAVDAE